MSNAGRPADHDAAPAWLAERSRTAQKTTFRLSCQLRGSPAVLVIVPKAVLVGVVLGDAKLVWFRAL